MSAEGGIAAIGAQNIAFQEKHEAEAKPAYIQEQAKTAQGKNAGMTAELPHHEAPIKYYGVDPRDKQMEQKLILAELAKPGPSKAAVLPQMYSDNNDVAQWIQDKIKIAEADQFINELLTFYDLTSLAEKRAFDAKFPWIKQLKLKRMHEVANMHIRLAELCENADPSIEDVKYIIDLLHGKASLPPPILPPVLNAALSDYGLAAGGNEFFAGMFNPFTFTNPLKDKKQKQVIEALGTNVLGKGFEKRWKEGKTHKGPETLKDWTKYFLDQAIAGKPANPPAGAPWNVGSDFKIA